MPTMRSNGMTHRVITASSVALLLMASVVVASSFAGGEHGPEWKPRGGQPLVIGHRGSAGYRPEHTLGSYALAARMGADYVEPDLVSTKDSVLVARHEPEISATTDVADHPEFADRKTTRNLDGVQVTGWFTDDFTLAELKTLRAKERIPDIRQRNTLYDGRYEIPTFQEVIDLTSKLSRELGRPIGIYAETKHPTYFQQRGLALEPPLVKTLRRNGLDDRHARDAAGNSLPPTDFVRRAHRAGLLVHPYTFRNENTFLPAELRKGADPTHYGNAFGEYEQFYELGVDGLFSDNADTAVEARAAL
jgi:glycerophosphoryl diester phosphodiesterase